MDFKTHLSASKIKKYRQCPQKFYLDVIEGCPRMESNNQKALNVGTAFHEMMELEHEGKFDRNNQDDIDALGLTHEEKEEALSIYDKYKNMRDSYGNSEHTPALSNELEIDTNVGGIHFKGAIDKFVDLDDDTFLILDYKTNRSMYSVRDIKNDPQVIVYAYYVWQQFMNEGDGTIIFVFDFVKFKHGEIKVVIDINTESDYHGSVNWDKETFLSKWNSVKSVYKRILNDEEHKPHLTPLCSYCSVRGCCDRYNEILEEPMVIEDMPEDIDELIELYNKAKSIKSIADARRKEVRDIINEKLERGQEPKRFDVNPRQRRRKSRPISYMLDNLSKEVLQKLMTVREKDLKECEIDEETMDMIDDLTVMNVTATWNMYKEKEGE